MHHCSSLVSTIFSLPKLNVGSESDVQGFVKNFLTDMILAAKLKCCYNRFGTEISSTWWKASNFITINDVPIKSFADVYNQAIARDPVEVLENCIATCASQQLVHDDIEWRHVALFHQKRILTNTYTLKCNFIDLSNMSSVKTKSQALESMNVITVR